MLFQLKATFYNPYIVLITYNCVHSCFSTQELALYFPLSKSRNPVVQLNPHLVPSEKIFTDQKYVILLKSYDDFNIFVYFASTVKQTLETKKSTEEDYCYLPYRALWYNNA